LAGKEVASKAADMKPQGDFASSKSMGRSTGSSFANAVSFIVKEAREKNQTFQEEKKVLDPREHVDRSMLYKGKGQKKKQGE
jgi:hypothetical protein